METWQAILLSITVTGTIALIGFAIKAALWAGGVNSDRKWFKGTLEKLGEKLDKLQDALLRHLPESRRVDSPGSPRTLTNLGKKVSREISAEEWAGKLVKLEDLISQVKGKSDYEVQEFSIAYALFDLEPSEEELKTLHKCAYNNGINVYTVRRVLGIVLRDAFLRFKKAST